MNETDVEKKQSIENKKKVFMNGNVELSKY